MTTNTSVSLSLMAYIGWHLAPKKKRKKKGKPNTIFIHVEKNLLQLFSNIRNKYLGCHFKELYGSFFFFKYTRHYTVKDTYFLFL